MRLLSAMFYFITKMKFSKLLNKLNSIPFINQGGCGYAAMCIYNWLKANNRLATDFKVAFVHSDSDQESFVHNSIHENKIACTHIMIFNDGKFIDSTGMYKLRNGILKTSNFNANKRLIVFGTIEGLQHALEHSNWNPLFDKKDIQPFLNNTQYV